MGRVCLYCRHARTNHGQLVKALPRSSRYAGPSGQPSSCQSELASNLGTSSQNEAHVNDNSDELLDGVDGDGEMLHDEGLLQPQHTQDDTLEPGNAVPHQSSLGVGVDGHAEHHEGGGLVDGLEHIDGSIGGESEDCEADPARLLQDDWEEFASVSSDDEGTSGEEEGWADGAEGPGTGRYFASHFEDPVFDGASLTVLQVIYFLLSWRHKFGVSREAMDVLLKFLSKLMPVGNLFPYTTQLQKSALGVSDWSKYEVHVCAREKCTGHRWKYIPKKEWFAHEHDTCPHCNGPRFEVSMQSGRKKLKPCFWYIDLKVEEVIKEDFFGNSSWSLAYNRATRAEAPGSYYGSPEHARMRSKFDAARVNTRGSFDDKETGHWELITDAGQPYKSVQHSTNLIGLRCASLDVFDKCKNYNMQPVIIVPGPIQPPNLMPYLLRTLQKFELYGLKRPGIPLHQKRLDPQEHALQEDVQEALQPIPATYHRVALTGKCTTLACQAFGSW